MRKVVIIIIICLTAVLSPVRAASEQKDTAFRQLYQHYFQLYGQPDKEKEFFEASEKMKAYYLKNGNTTSYYKIRQNEVLYDTENGKIYRAITRANDMLEDMKKEGVKHYDMVYTVLATIYESRGNYRMADYYYKDALKNAAPTDSGALISIYSRLASLKTAREPKEAYQWNEKFGAMSHNFPDYYKVYLALKGEINFYMGNRQQFMNTYRDFHQYIKDHAGLDNYGVDVMEVMHMAFNENYKDAIHSIQGRHLHQRHQTTGPHRQDI